MNEDTKANLLNGDTWIRLLYMVLFALLLGLARLVILCVALLQFVLVLITGKPNQQLLELGQGTAKWAFQAFLFITYNSDVKPFPFADWPETELMAQETEKDIAPQPMTTEVASSDDVPSFVTPQHHTGNDAGDQDGDKV